VIWYAISAGMCLSFGVCHLALGMKRPIQPRYLAFAAMMGFIAPFQLALGGLNSTRSMASAIVFARVAVALAIAFMVLFAVFVRHYTAAPVPRAVAVVFFLVSGAFLAYDLVSPTGLIFSARAKLSEGSFTRVPFEPLHLLWQAFNAATVLWAAAAGWRMARRGRPSQGMILILGSIALLAAVLVDLIRNVLEREWPYIGGFGVMAMTIFLSVRLALDFRNDELLLAHLVREAMRVRDQLNTPLQTLHLGLEIAVAEGGTMDQEQLGRLQRAVNRLIELGRRLQITSAGT
jgi:hypothetical protein